MSEGDVRRGAQQVVSRCTGGTSLASVRVWSGGGGNSSARTPADFKPLIRTGLIHLIRHSDVDVHTISDHPSTSGVDPSTRIQHRASLIRHHSISTHVTVQASCSYHSLSEASGNHWYIHGWVGWRRDGAHRFSPPAPQPISTLTHSTPHLIEAHSSIHSFFKTLSSSFCPAFTQSSPSLLSRARVVCVTAAHSPTRTQHQRHSHTEAQRRCCTLPPSTTFPYQLAPDRVPSRRTRPRQLFRLPSLCSASLSASRRVVELLVAASLRLPRV